MPQKRELNAKTLTLVEKSIKETFNNGLLVSSIMSSYFKENDSIRKKWDNLIEEMKHLRLAIPAEIKRRLSN